MIGIPQRLVPKDRRRRVVLCVVSLLATLVAAVWYAIVSIRLEFGGERHVEMDKNIAASLLDSSAVGLERFRAQRGHYPQVSGKYFFDSIKTMVHVPEVYIYADSMTTEGRMVPLRISRGKRFPYEQVPNTYLGVGNAESFLNYRSTGEGTYLLYWVGINEIDEQGGGDDVRR